MPPHAASTHQMVDDDEPNSFVETYSEIKFSREESDIALLQTTILNCFKIVIHCPELKTFDEI